jgi:hypothetical protein
VRAVLARTTVTAATSPNNAETYSLHPYITQNSYFIAGCQPKTDWAAEHDEWLVSSADECDSTW